MLRTKRRWIGAFVLIAAVFTLLNSGQSAATWTAWNAAPHGSLVSAVAVPFLTLYRRFGVEELYFATASAFFGRPYDPKPFQGRGDSPLPPMTVVPDGHIHLPYLEIPSEYPPPNVPFIVAPAIFTEDYELYVRLFGLLMGALLFASAMIASKLAGGDERDRTERLIGFGLLLLAHGAISIQCLDAIVALVLILVVRSAVRRDDFSFGLWSGLAFAAKFLPVITSLALLVADGLTSRDALRAWRPRLPRMAFGAVVGVVVGLGPMMLAPGSFSTMLRYHGGRGLQVESTLGVLYGTAVALAGHPEPTRADFGSFNFHGPGSLFLAKVSTLFLLGLLAIAIFASVRRAPPSNAPPSNAPPSNAPPSNDERTRRLVLAALATTIATWLGGKVFSPQYLTWGLPLVLAIPQRAWRRYAIGLGAVLILSQAYLRGYYVSIWKQEPIGIATLDVRLALLIALFVFVCRSLKGVSGAPQPSNS